MARLTMAQWRPPPLYAGFVFCIVVALLGTISLHRRIFRQTYEANYDDALIRAPNTLESRTNNIVLSSNNNQSSINSPTESNNNHNNKMENRQTVRIALCKEDFRLGEGVVYSVLRHAIFPSDRYNVTTIVTTNGVVPPDQPNVDMLLCLGYFYPQNVTQHRTKIGNVYGKRLDPPLVSGESSNNGDDVYWPKQVDLVPHYNRPFQMSFSMEAIDKGQCRYDVMIIVTKSYHNFRGCPIIFWPFVALSFFRRPNATSTLLPTLVRSTPHEEEIDNNNTMMASLSKQILEEKKKKQQNFCAFIVQHCWFQFYRNNDVMVRVIFYDILAEQYKRPSSFGKCRNTEGHGSIIRKNTNIVNDLQPVVEILRNFKFSLVFENNVVDGYVTEKIMNGLLADTIPIYWGAPDIGEYINLDRIIHCNFDGPALEEFRQLPKPRNMTAAEQTIQRGKVLLKPIMQSCINEVMELDQNEELFRKKLSQPILPNNQLKGSYFDLGRIASSIRTVMKAYNSSLV